MVIRRSTPRDAEPVGAMAAEFQAYLRDLGDKTEFDWGASKYLRDGLGDNPAFEGCGYGFACPSSPCRKSVHLVS